MVTSLRSRVAQPHRRTRRRVVPVTTQLSWAQRKVACLPVKFHVATTQSYTVGWCWYRIGKALEGRVSGLIWDGIRTWRSKSCGMWCSWASSSWLFENSWCLHIQGYAVQEELLFFYFLDCLTLHINAWWRFETSKTTRPTASRPRGLCLQQLRCKKHQILYPAFIWTDCGSHENIAHDSREFPPGPPDCESEMPPTGPRISAQLTPTVLSSVILALTCRTIQHYVMTGKTSIWILTAVNNSSSSFPAIDLVAFHGLPLSL
jgi:hypothetical protein